VPWEGGRIFGWLTYLDAEITNQPGAEDGWFCFERALLGLNPCPAEDPDETRPDGSPRRPTDFTGNQLPWSPKWSTTVNIEHNWWLENNLRLSPYLSVHWQDEMFFSDNNFDEAPFHSGQEAFATADLALRLISEQKRWAVEAYVRNLTDEMVRSWSDPGPGYLRANFFPPRMWGVKFRKDF
jgi:iron complex outermembrane receptor protein